MTQYGLVLVAALLALLPALPGQEGSDPALEEFKRFIRDPDWRVRADQIDRLARRPSPDAAKLVIGYGFVDPEPAVRDRAIVAASMMGSEASRKLVLEALEDRNPAIREGAALTIAKVPDFRPSPVEALTELIGEDREAAVRTAASLALGERGDRAATPALLEILDHREDAVVIAALDALAMIEDPDSAKGILPLLDHDAWRVQVAALNALSEIRVKESIAPIIAYLRESEGRPREDARRALTKITQRNFGMGALDWEDWWSRVKDGWTVPPEKKEKPPEEEGNRGYGKRPTRYHRITTYSKKLVFVIDISNSMCTPILLKAGKTSDPDVDPVRQAVPKIEIAREELAFALRGLDPEAKFNVIAFNAEVHEWKDAPVRANSGNIARALRFIEKLAPDPGRGSSRRFGNSGPDMTGKTNTHAALAAVFGKAAVDRRRLGATTPSNSPSRKKAPYDTCFFLSDGAPTAGHLTDVEEILEEVRRWNRSARIVIHCIGMEESAGLTELLRGVARITGGECEFVGR